MSESESARKDKESLLESKGVLLDTRKSLDSLPEENLIEFFKGTYGEGIIYTPNGTYGMSVGIQGDISPVSIVRNMPLMIEFENCKRNKSDFRTMKVRDLYDRFNSKFTLLNYDIELCRQSNPLTGEILKYSSDGNILFNLKSHSNSLKTPVDVLCSLSWNGNLSFYNIIRDKGDFK